MPIDDDWISKLNILKREDVQCRKSKWLFTPVLVTGNLERRAIIEYKVKLFGQTMNEPILRWICKVKEGTEKRQNLYSELKFDPVGIYDELIQYFVLLCVSRYRVVVLDYQRFIKKRKAINLCSNQNLKN